MLNNLEIGVRALALVHSEFFRVPTLVSTADAPVVEVLFERVTTASNLS